jgi:hypothetical protein
VISHSLAFRASRRFEFSYKSILPCTAFPSTLVSILELSPPLPSLLLLRVGGLSRLNTRDIRSSVVEQLGNKGNGRNGRCLIKVVPPAITRREPQKKNLARIKDVPAEIRTYHLPNVSTPLSSDGVKGN